VDILISMINVAVLIYFLFILLKGIKIKYLACSLGAIFILLFGFYILKQHGPVFLSDLEPSKYSQQWGRLMKDRSIDGNRPTVNGFIYEKGIGTHASSSITYILDGRYRYLDGAVGLDDEQNRGNKIEFFVYADDTLIYDSGILQGVIYPRTLYLNIAGAKELKLVVGDGGDGINCDHADWLTMELLP
jgi:hypothetical protein